MTFTNKAANEMKVRILDKLIQLSKTPHDRTESDQKEIKDYAKALAIDEKILCERASIQLNLILHHYSLFGVMTIDKFTHRVIRTFARELGLSLDFEVELDIKTLRGNVADLLFDQIGRSDEITTLMTKYAEKNLQDDKRWDFKDSLVTFSAELFKEDALDAIKLLQDYDAEKFEKAQQTIIKENQIFINQLQSVAQLGIDLVESNGLHHTDDFKQKSGGVPNKFLKILSGKIEPLSKTHLSFLDENEWGHKSSNNEELVNSISSQLQVYLRQINDLFEQSYPQYVLNTELLKIINNLSLMNHLLKMTEEVKQNENVLLISDFYKMIAEIITKEPVPFIYERLGVRYEHFLLDEFQDTSHLQWVNLVPLLHNSLSQGFSNLIVGDGKQAIYRWRNGEVDQFIKLPEEIHNPGVIVSLKEAESTFKNEGIKIQLENNFRSAPEIVDFNNRLFEFLTQEKDKLIQDIYKGGSQHPQKKHQGYVEIKALEDKENDWQLEYILSCIDQAIKQQYAYQDICILVNKNDLGALVASHLSQHNINVVSKDSLYVGKDQEVKFVYNLIGAIASPQNQNYAKKAIEHFDLIKEYDSHLFQVGQDRIKITEWMQEMGIELTPYERFHSFYEYVEHLIIKFDLSIAENRYLEYFLEQVFEFEKRNNGNIHAFLEWFEEHGCEESLQSPEGADAVNIMTIHKAKGLQFPVVICAFFDWDVNKNLDKRWIIDKEAHLPAFILPITKSTKESSYKDIFDTETIKHEMDELNKMYVALTRAESALFICGSSKKNKPLIKEFILPQLYKMGIEENENTYKIGAFVKNQNPKVENLSIFNLPFCQQVMDKPKLSTTNGDHWEVDEIDRKRKFGTQLHLLLASIHSQNEIVSKSEELLLKGKISPDLKEDLLHQANALFQDDHFNSYFEADEILNERVIIDQDGQQHIPDKILLRGNEVLIVDFKSGEEQDKHFKQVGNYIQLLREMGHENVRGELFYTETLTAKSVPF